MPALMPEKRRARAKTVPAAGAIEVESRAWMLKRSASSLSGADEGEYRLAPATMRMAELTKRANVKRETAKHCQPLILCVSGVMGGGLGVIVLPRPLKEGLSSL